MQYNSKIAQYLGNNYLVNNFASKKEAYSTLTPINLIYTKGNKSGMGGIPIFHDNNYAYVDSSDDHNLIIGSTGSMKSRAVIEPLAISLCSANENVVILDPKGEIYDKTSGYYKKNGYNIKKIDFRNMDQSDSFNPLNMPFQYIRNSKNPELINLGKRMLNDLSSVLCDGFMCNSQDPYWNIASKELLDGLLSHLVYSCDDVDSCNLANLKPLLIQVAKPCDEDHENYFKNLLDKLPDTYYPKQKLYQNITLADKTKSCVVSFVNSYIAPFIANKELDKILSNNTIDLTDFAKDDIKTVLYIIVPDEKSTYNMICSIIIKQLYNVLIFEAQNKKYKTLTNKVNFILDEFANIPKIPDMPNMISASRSRNIRWHIVLQCNSQLLSKYGKYDASTIKNNCQNWIYLNTREKDLMDEVINLIGKNKYDNSQDITPTDLLSIKKHFPYVRAMIINKNTKPFVTDLYDISLYKNIMKDADNPIYPPVEIKTVTSKNKTYLFNKKYNAYMSSPISLKKIIDLDDPSGSSDKEIDDSIRSNYSTNEVEYEDIGLPFEEE